MAIMNTCMRYMKRGFKAARIAFLFSFAAFAGAQGQEVNGTQQLLNRGFEQYDNLGSKNVEPVGWNSFMTARTSGGLVDMGKDQRLDREAGGRPSSAGTYCLKVYSTSILGINANGNVTTGRINMGSTTATDASNHNFTDRASAGFNFPFTAVPDSMVVWVKYSPNNASDQGQIKAIIHDDCDMKDPGTDMNRAVAISTINPAKGNGGWIRYSMPFSRSGCGSSNPRYVLVSITTNKVPGGGGATMWVDDILFIYNPTLSMGSLPMLSFNMRDGAQEFELPYAITGTMSPNTHPANPNEVIAELSDASGSFASPRQVGKAVSDVSGSLTVTFPADIPLGDHYRLRLRSTNYPLLTPDNGQDIVLMRGFTVNLAKNGDFGTVSGAGAYREGSMATVKAEANIGYHFVRWEENGQEVPGAGETYSFEVDRDRDLTAVFEVNTYDLELAVEGVGELDPPAGHYRYQHNDRVTLTATPGAGYELAGFYQDGVLLSSNPVYSFNMTSSRSITAVFEPGKIQIAAHAAPSGLGSVRGAGLYEMGSEVTLTAVPMPFCNFVAWVEGADTVGRESVIVFAADAPRNLTAVFSEEFHTVALQASPAGAGVLSGAGRFSAARDNTDIVLHATPNEGYRFLYWESDGSGERVADNPYAYMEQGRLTQDLSFTAYFEAVRCRLDLSANLSGAGTLSGAGEYSYRQAATVEAFPAEGYDFVAWVRLQDGSIDTVSHENPYSFAIRQDVRMEAVFALRQYALALDAEPAGGGSVAGAGLYPHGDTAAIEALPGAEYEFRYWAERRGLTLDSLSSDNPYLFPILSAKALVAVFGPKPKWVQAVCVPEEGGRVSGAGYYQAGDYARLQAEEAYGYHFDSWVDASGRKLHYDRNLQHLVSRDTVFRALFEPNLCALTVMTENAGDEGKVGIDSLPLQSRIQTEALYGQELLLCAKAEKAGYRFSHWRVQGQGAAGAYDSVYSRQEQVVFKVAGDAVLTAAFLYDAKEVAAAVYPDASWGKVENQGNYRTGDWVELRAVARRGYAFQGWEDCRTGQRAGTGHSCFVPVIDDTLVCARFVRDTVAIEATVAGAPAMGSVSGGGLYEYGSEVRLHAEAGYGYVFGGWYALSDTAWEECLETRSDYVFEADADLSLSALFVPARFGLQAVAEPENAGEVLSASTYAYGSYALLEALPAEGFAFSAWIVDNGGEPDTMKEPLLRLKVTKEEKITACFVPVRCHWEVDAEGSGQGEVKGVLKGDTAYGSRLVFQAVGEGHHVFSAWVDAAGNKVSEEESLVIGLFSDTLLYARFEPGDVRLEARALDPLQGYVDAYQNRIPFGSKVVVEAKPMPGYVFEKWVSASDTAVEVSRSSLLELRMTGDSALSALFKPALYQANLSVRPQAGGEARFGKLLAGDTLRTGTYAEAVYGEKLLLEAVPAPHYAFSAWVEDGITLGEEPLLETEVDSDSHIEAVFEPMTYQLSLEVEPVSFGTVSGQGAFAYGEMAEAEAVPGQRYRFVGWRSSEGWISDSARLPIALDKDTLLVAVFEVDSVRVDVRAGAGGTAGGGGLFERSAQVELEAVPYPGFDFAGWQDMQGRQVSEENPYVFSAEEENTYKALFASSRVNVQAAANTGGAVSGGGEYGYGNTVELFAQADSGYRFEAWRAQGMELSSLQARVPYLCVDATRDLAFEAVFTPEKFEVSTRVSPVGCGTATAGGVFDFGSRVSFQAVADANHVFLGWTKDGRWVGNDALLEAEVEGNACYVAMFEPKQVKVRASAYPEEGGLVYGSGTYYWGDTIRVGITPYAGYEFDNWLNAAFEQVSLEEVFYPVLTRAEMFTANLSGNGGGNGDGDGDGDGEGSGGGDGSDSIGPGPGPEPGPGGEEEKQFRVYPNPIAPDGVLFIEMEEPVLRYVRIFSVSGRHMYYVQVSDQGVQEAKLNLPSHLKGCFIYELGLSDGKARRGKLVKL